MGCHAIELQCHIMLYVYARVLDGLLFALLFDAFVGFVVPVANCIGQFVDTKFARLAEKSPRWSRNMSELGGANRDILKRQLQILRKAPNQRTPEDVRAFAASLSKATFFQDLGEHEKMQVCQYLKLEGAPRDTTVFKQGDRGDKFYLILCGSVGRASAERWIFHSIECYWYEVQNVGLVLYSTSMCKYVMLMADSAQSNATWVANVQKVFQTIYKISSIFFFFQVTWLLVTLK